MLHRHAPANLENDDGRVVGGLCLPGYFPILSCHLQLVAEVRSWFVKCCATCWACCELAAFGFQLACLYSSATQGSIGSAGQVPADEIKVGRTSILFSSGRKIASSASTISNSMQTCLLRATGPTNGDGGPLTYERRRLSQSSDLCSS